MSESAGWVVDLDAGGPHADRRAVEGFTSHLVWSLDDERLAFDRTACPGGTDCIDPQVIVIGAEGAALETVATSTDPSWSPNSRQLLLFRPAR